MTPNEVLTQLSPLIAGYLFDDSTFVPSKNGIYNIRSMAAGACKAVDIGTNRFVTQNPNKSSKWAKMARDGHEIIWIIHTPTNKWVGRVVDGVYTKL